MAFSFLEFRWIYDLVGLGNYHSISGRIYSFLSKNPDPELHAIPPTTETIHLVKERALHIMKELGYAE